MFGQIYIDNIFKLYIPLLLFICKITHLLKSRLFLLGYDLCFHLRFRDVFRTLPNIEDHTFCKKPLFIFAIFAKCPMLDDQQGSKYASGINNKMACILKTVFKNALLKTVFSGGRLGAGVVVGCQISIQPYTNVKQPICSKLKVKNTDIICYMLT